MTLLLSLTRLRIGLPYKFLMVIGLTKFSSWLFLDEFIPPGISVPIFFLTLVACAIVANPVHATARQFYTACIVFGLSMLPLVENVGLTSLVIGIAGSLYFLAVMSGAWPRAKKSAIKLLFCMLFKTPARFLADFVEGNKKAKRLGSSRINGHSLVIGCLATAIGIIILHLFAISNPLISYVLTGYMSPFFFEWRLFSILYWIIFLFFSWVFVGFTAWRHRQLWHLSSSPAHHKKNRLFGNPGPFPVIFSERGLVCLLVVFNLAFALQTIFDILYLWLSITPPKGMSYDYYVRTNHSRLGLYVLLIPAIMAISFIMLAMRDGGEGIKSRRVCRLVLLWVSQNIFLVLSSMQRLTIYIKTHSLTYIHIYSLICMAVLIAGFILIAARIYFKCSNNWLLKTKALMVVAVLYISCFLNFPFIIVNHNTAWVNAGSRLPKCAECMEFDIRYALSMGKQSYPAIDDFLTALPAAIQKCRLGQDAQQQTQKSNANEIVLTQDICRKMELHYTEWIRRRNVKVSNSLNDDLNWRNWSYRKHRALAYLKSTPSLQPVTITR